MLQEMNPDCKAELSASACTFTNHPLQRVAFRIYSEYIAISKQASIPLYILYGRLARYGTYE